MSDDRIGLRKIVRVEAVDRPYAFTASAFCGPHAFVVDADPAEMLSIAHAVPRYQKEFVGKSLARYRFERLLAQDGSCPVVMPSIGIPFYSGEKISLYDAGLVRGLIEKGVRRMPFCLQGLDKNVEAFVKLCPSADSPKPLKDYRPDMRPEELAGVDQSEFTIAFCMEEMIRLIDAHYDQHMLRHKFPDRTNFYDAFPLCRDMLDVLIASGCQYTTPERYWDGESILTSMQEHIENRKRQIGTDNPSAIELIDRFSLLHERKMKKDAAATLSHMGIIELAGENTLFQLSWHIADQIMSNPEARELIVSELSPPAQLYFRSLREAIHQPGINKPAATPA